MAYSSQSDISRAREALREGLADLDLLRQRGAACGDRQLRSLLQQIEQDKARQTARLLDWLQNHGPGLGIDLDPGYAAEDKAVLLESPDAGVMEAAALGKVESTESGYRLEVIELRKLTADLLIFKVPRPPDFSFIPGQAAKLMLDGIQRDYSIVSAPHEPFLEFFVELVPAGPMSERLRKLTQGSLVTLRARPKGKFVLNERFPTHLMVATVTGVNPYVSILRAYLHAGRRGQRFYILHGASYQDEFGYRDELARLAATHPDVLTYIPTVSRPDEPRNVAWTGERGRVDTIVAKYLEQFGLDAASTLLYACGNPGMVDEIERQFVPQGFAVKVERYY